MLRGQGILTLQPTSQPKEKEEGLYRHQVAMFLLGFPAISFGTFSIFRNKQLHDSPSFVSWHGVS